MMLQNDATIKKSPELFKQYNDAALYGTRGGQRRPEPAGGDPGAASRIRRRTWRSLGMENLIRPIANNIIAIQTMLDSPTACCTGTGRADDDQQLQAIRAKLLKALAAQNASLDIISGFVDTQQMAELQHAGQAYISSLSQPDKSGARVRRPARSIRSQRIPTMRGFRRIRTTSTWQQFRA